MQQRELTCINCPMGCTLTVTLEGDAVTAVRGHSCPRGEAYARAEIAAPVRTVTTCVPCLDAQGRRAMLSVRTAAPVPKAATARVLQAVKAVTAAAPVAVGDVVLPNVAGLGVDVIATKEIL